MSDALITSLAPKHWWSARLLTGLSDGDAVSTFTDQGSGALNFTASGSDRPTYETNELNGHPVLRFSGSQYMTAGVAADWAFLHNGSPHTIVVLFKPSGSNPDALYSLLDTCAAGATANVGMYLATDDRSSVPRNNRVIWATVRGVVSNPTFSDGGADNDLLPDNWTTVTARYDEGADIGGAVEYQIAMDNAVSRAGDSTNAPSASNPTGTLHLARSVSGTSFFLTGDVAEVLVFDSYLQSFELEQVYRYIQTVYPTAVLGRQNRINQNTAHDAFPGLCSRRGGKSPLICALRRGSTHVDDGDRGVIVHAISYDGDGIAAQKVALRDGTYDLRDPALCRVADDHLVLSFFKYGIQTLGPITDAVGIAEATTFDDDGLPEWGTPTYLNDAFTGWSACSAPVVVLANGDWIMPFYGMQSGGTYESSRLQRRTGGTGSWGNEVTIGNGPTDSKRYNEPNIIEYSSGNLICAVRNDTDSRIDFFYSTDSGATWGSRQTGFSGSGRPAMILDGSRIWLTYRGTSNYSAYKYSDDNGSTWSSEFRLDRRTDMYTYAQFAQYGNGEIWLAYSWQVSSTSAFTTLKKWEAGSGAGGVGMIAASGGGAVPTFGPATSLFKGVA